MPGVAWLTLHCTIPNTDWGRCYLASLHSMVSSSQWAYSQPLHPPKRTDDFLYKVSQDKPQANQTRQAQHAANQPGQYTSVPGTFCAPSRTLRRSGNTMEAESGTHVKAHQDTTTVQLSGSDKRKKEASQETAICSLTRQHMHQHQHTRDASQPATLQKHLQSGEWSSRAGAQRAHALCLRARPSLHAHARQGGLHAKHAAKNTSLQHTKALLRQAGSTPH